MPGLTWVRIHWAGPRRPIPAHGRRVTALGGLAIVMVALTPWGPPSNWPLVASAADLSGVHKIQHVVIIVQENRSFDH